ncbi:ShlB/FhaC/HecB family hemolysin secretion/activation protein [Acinetobacter rathckeae]|uniref:ShlB/FhaC/HecB family hemolysin secretion/activation protein n=1 Tax=Acinetobacter rathckeae TaxID=2605272 RepID=UPI001BB2FA8D|nr:ShlB/FhaC/HecB family hemolysin secretion/activation protein [Acinetobacter rathckeae]
MPTDPYIQQQQKSEQINQQIQPSPRVNFKKEQNIALSQVQLSRLKSHSEEVCFPVQHLILEGDQAKEFTFAVVPFTHGKNNIIGRCLGVEGLNQLVELIQNKIIEKGYITTRVLLPQQNVSSGSVRFTVVAGKVNAINFSSNTSKRAHKFNALPIRHGDILNVRDIEQGLENFKRVSTVDADFKIRPAEVGQPGYSDLDLTWKQSRPYRIHLSLDDSGSKTTGKYQGTATMSFDHLLTLNDLFYTSYTHDVFQHEKNKGSTSVYLNYTVPWDYFLFSVNYSDSKYSQNVVGKNENYQYRGNSNQLNFDITYLVYRDAYRKVSLGTGGWWRQSHNFINDVEVLSQYRRTGGWQFHIDYTEYLNKATITSRLSYKRGTGAFGAIPSSEEQFNEAFTRVGIWQANSTLQIPFKISSTPFSYSMDLRYQYSDKILTPQDRFSIGNRYSVRGFSGEETLVGTNGFSIRNEFNSSLFNSPHLLYWAIDYGSVGGKSYDYIENKPSYQKTDNHLLGTAIGLKGQISKLNLNYDIFVSTPLEQPTKMKPDHLVTGLNLNWNF